ncbi:MAG: hypothetical protein QGH42_03585 [Kiritimatiellia bacterium]|jgi:hypothetical protein|nr:hypothetical protein [Kiritimatiellia bacterium]MDP6630217.1 hypothetical protein [Kiritimatiellia bacterium]MDP6810695.1 hypothetical protein [Kiritimatiellia bacterium]MDP7023318.1 hypothetical protein [Kiritimatiellia bacterium]
MTVLSKQRRVGITRLEVVFGVTIVALIAVFVLLLGPRENRGTDSGASADELASDDSVSASSVYSGSNFAYDDGDLSSADDYAAGNNAAADMMAWERELSREAANRAPATTSVATRDAVVVGTELRAYFGKALPAEGAPNWDRFIALSRDLDAGLFPEAWSLLQEQPWSRAKDEAVELFVLQWSSRDPEAAIEFAMTIGSSRQRHTVLATATEAWATRDPEGALAWYHGRIADGLKPVGQSHFLEGLYASAPDTALALIWEMDDLRRQEGLLRALFLSSREEHEQGAAQLKSMFDLSEDPAQREMLARMVAGTWAADDPMRAIAWASELEDEPDVQERVIMTALQSWGRREPGTAMEWLLEQELPQTSRGAVYHIAKSWSRDNPAGLREWVREASPSHTRDTVIASHVQDLRYRDPATALRVAEQMTNEKERYKLMSSVADRWIRSDRAAAAPAILSSGMPDAMKRKYAMQLIPKGQKVGGRKKGDRKKPSS